MRVRPQRPTDRRSRADRRPHVIGRPVEEAAAPEVVHDADLVAERRHRASVKPEDHATYHCGCGYVFEAEVTTSVVCPNCSAGQAW